MEHENLISFLIDQDCPDGIFVLNSKNVLISTPSGFYEDRSIDFFDTGAWRDAEFYICAANLSKTIWRFDQIWYPIYLAGVDLSGSDLSYSDFSNTIFEDILQVDDLQFDLSADLTGIVHNDQTSWPEGFIPPPSAEP